VNITVAARSIVQLWRRKWSGFDDPHMLLGKGFVRSNGAPRPADAGLRRCPASDKLTSGKQEKE